MRGFLVTSAVTACAATLTLPVLGAPGAASAPARPAAAPPRVPGAAPVRAPGAVPAAHAAPAKIPGATYSLPLVPLPTADGTGAALPGRSQAPQAGTGIRGLRPQRVKPFSMVGIVWDDAGAELRGRAQVRTRAVGGRTWSGWQDVQVQDHDRPDGSEARSGLRGATAPLWVGASDAIEVRVRPGAAAGRPAGSATLPRGLRAELVDPGSAPAARTRSRAAAPAPDDEERATSAVNAPLAPLGAHEIPAATHRPTAEEVATLTAVAPGASVSSSGTRDGRDGRDRHDGRDGTGGTGDRSGAEEDASAAEGAAAEGTDPGDASDASAGTSTDTSGETGDSGEAGVNGETGVNGEHGPADSAAVDDDTDTGTAYAGHAGPRPRIVTRAGWGADESMRERGFVYTKKVKAAFVHHTASGNGYTCAQSPSVIRGIYRYHVVSSGWRDIGYNFLIDKCGTVYEGRAGGVAKPVKGAHTLGFNTNSMGIAVLGTYGTTSPAKAAVNAVAALTAWKLGLYNANPRGTTTLVSAGGNLFKKGAKVKLKVISGHRDGYSTECPGDRLYAKLGTARSTAARLQGR
ncbi:MULTISPECIES: peptidoglycan recognition protein family protein [Streptomyces]|uniref:peptidoglycan recognition protein family protein n=1 Tax=Streptomyces TaxID=1883 RepID=UPI00163BB59E|nr:MULTISPECIES: peptidoglycan recognition protein [Streptomyces]MBC2879197.1 peptidoglycan recognition protein [Streptomyces sp. TYQ1024]UBI38550.1 peptidoglycan recognition protein [Streptomyces mobaraensis]UKW31134.1 peptidoglycan recognition protein [Streptomyces sp. TYQ1024]